ncbi:MAG: hypothetical protein NC307_07930 [Roseburia sp.]|nr:hypothetical protein [Roseburia sp.]
MIPTRNLNDKSYEQFMGEAIVKIPLYSKEWTNYNPTDPGITVLENLSAFSALQRQELNEVTEEIRCRFLEMTGFFRREGILGKCYVRRKEYIADRKYLPEGQKMYAGDVCFETEEGAELYDAGIYDFYAICRGKRYSLKALTVEYGIPTGVEIFGENPKGGEEIYFCFLELPSHKNYLYFYVEVSEIFKRTPFCMEDVKLFANMSWQVYTEQGFTEIKVEDGTCLFLKSGVIKVHLPPNHVVREPGSGHYQVRCVLQSCAYDLPPKVASVRGILTEAVQRDTKSAVLFFPGEARLLVEHFLLKEGNFQVFVEEESEKFYLREEISVKDEGEYRKVLLFDSSIQGKSVMLLCQEPEIFPYRILGRLYGYDHQEFLLPPFSRVYSGKFSLLIEEKREGRACYHNVFPKSMREGEVFYTLEEESGKVIVEDCGAFEGGRVLLADYCLYQGSGGNVVKGAELVVQSGEEKCVLENCMEGFEGRFQETFQEMQKRFVFDLQRPFTMVTAADCEILLKQIPGLSIHKMRAIAFPEKNEIKIVIKPNSRDACPRLSPLYQKIVVDFLEDHRILNTRITIEQPRYVPVHVHALICVKKHYENCERTVEDLFRRILDGAGLEGEFGETVSFHKIYQTVENLDCVEEIRELSLRPGLQGGMVEGLDIRMGENALYCPGELSIEFVR